MIKKSEVTAEQIELHRKVDQYIECQHDNLIVENFTVKEKLLIREFIEKEQSLKDKCTEFNFPYDPPNSEQTDYKRHMKMHMRIRYHKNKGNV